MNLSELQRRAGVIEENPAGGMDTIRKFITMTTPLIDDITSGRVKTSMLPMIQAHLKEIEQALQSNKRRIDAQQGNPHMESMFSRAGINEEQRMYDALEPEIENWIFHTKNIISAIKEGNDSQAMDSANELKSLFANAKKQLM